ncbi:MAG: hypothetical protein ABI193_18020 [Minicystis sp.]
MDNPARIIALVFTPGAIQPCIRILKGLNVASRDQNATFSLRMAFSYFSGGVHVPNVYYDQQISSTQFLADLDPQWVRARGDVVRLTGPAPDPRSPVICTVLTSIVDARGNTVDMGTAETTSFNAP